MNCDDSRAQDPSPEMGYGPNKPQIKAEPKDIEQHSPYEFVALFFAVELFLGFIFAVLAIRHLALSFANLLCVLSSRSWITVG